MISPGTYTVAEVVRERPWGEKYPDLKSYYLKFQGDDQEYEWGTKTSSTAPAVGSQFEVGVVEPNGTYPPKIKKPKGNFGGGGGMTPEREAKVMRQHAQEMALRFAASTGWLNEIDLTDGETVGVVLNKQLRPLINWFDADAKAAKP